LKASSPRAAEPSIEPRYRSTVIVLHWLIAALIVGQLALGWYMNRVPANHSPAQKALERLHVSLGVTILLFIALRIVARLVLPQPRLPAALGAAGRALARTSHFAFYLLMLALPLTGWAIVSARHAPISFWGLGWPRLPGVAGLVGPPGSPLRPDLREFHGVYLAWLIVANLVLHVAGALKHQWDGAPVAWKMLPFLSEPPPRHGQ
jgi:cytochrome b561